MPTSPKRYAFIIDDCNWPLRDSLRESNPPDLTYSPCSSTASVDMFRPATPSTPSRLKNHAKRTHVPSLHFSTTDENVDAAEFHRMAAQMLSGEAPQDQFIGTIVDGDAHSIRRTDLDHITSTSHPCLMCDVICSSDEQLRRHVASRHNQHMEVCPECGDLFTADFLPTHLASGTGGCEGMMQASDVPQVDDAYMTDCYFTSASQRYWIYDGDHSWSRQSHHGFNFFGDDGNTTDKTVAHVKTVLKRPVSQMCTEACDLCGDRFNSASDEFAQHMGHHSQDYAQKHHKCEECQIYFANELDLERHLQSADLNQHCGFTFRHNEDTCTGHHRPAFFMSSTADDHSLMQKHLWAWERCQFQTNRLSLARVLAEKERASAVPEVFVEPADESYGPFVPHFTLAGREDSFHWSKDDPDNADVSEIDAHFSRIISQVFEADEAHSQTEISCRPESLALDTSEDIEDTEPGTERTSYVDLTALRNAFAQLKSGHKRNAFSGSLPLHFLKQAAQEADRPLSMPTIHIAQAVPFIKLGA